MKRSFWGVVWSNFRKMQGGLIIIIIIVIPLVLWRYPPDQSQSVPLVWAIPIGLSGIILILTFASAAYEMFQASKRILPAVILAKKTSALMPQAEITCLLKPSELFSHDSLVSFYYREEENFEQLIGLGTVRNIQEDGEIQVVMTYPLKPHQETIDKLAQNDAFVLKKILVKPNVPSTYISLIGHHEEHANE